MEVMSGEDSVTKRAALSKGGTSFGQLAPRAQMVRRLKVSAKCLKGRHRLQIDGELFGFIVERAAVNDLDVQPWQTRRSPCCIVFHTLTRQASSPWSLMR
jgi:hypothetical protein